MTKYLLSLAIMLALPGVASAQCANGRCAAPTGRPVVTVARAAAGPARVVRRVQPVRRVARIPLRLVFRGHHSHDH